MRHTPQRWLLTRSYLAGRRGGLAPGGVPAVALDAPYPSTMRWLEGAVRDDRTFRRAAAPDEVLDRREALRTARRIARYE